MGEIQPDPEVDRESPSPSEPAPAAFDGGQIDWDSLTDEQREDIEEMQEIGAAVLDAYHAGKITPSITTRSRARCLMERAKQTAKSIGFPGSDFAARLILQMWGSPPPPREEDPDDA